MDIEQLIKEGLDILVKNMELCPPFNPSKPYDEKNQYFLEVAKLSSPLFQYKGLVAPAERYYRKMLDAILEYEDRNAKVFNKGIVFANLGIAQIANGNLDEGINYLLMADGEDAAFTVNPHGVLEGELWHQFARHHVINNLVQLNEPWS